MILIAVLAALAVDSWLDERSERSDEAEYLRSLRAEFVSNRESLLLQIEEENRILEYCNQILSNIQSGQSELTPEEFVDKIRGFWILTSWTSSTGTFDELVGSGRLSYLQSEELRVALARYRNLVCRFASKFEPKIAISCIEN